MDTLRLWAHNSICKHLRRKGLLEHTFSILLFVLVATALNFFRCHCLAQPHALNTSPQGAHTLKAVILPSLVLHTQLLQWPASLGWAVPVWWAFSLSVVQFSTIADAMGE